MIKKIVLCFITVTCLGMFTSCQKKESGKDTGKSIIRFPQRYECVLDNITFRADIIVNNNVEPTLYESSAYPIVKDENKIIEELFLNHEKINEVEKQDKWTYTDKHGRTLYINRDSMTYASNSERYQNIVSNASLYTPESLTEKNTGIIEFTKGSLQEKRDSLVNTLKKMDIDGFNLYKCYQLDSTSSSKEKGSVLLNKTDSEREDTYWIGTETWQGLPVFSSSLYTGMLDAWAPLQVLVTSSGVEKLQVLYDFEFTKSDKKITLRSLDEIAEAIDKEYSMILSSNKYKVVKAELFYWVDAIRDRKKYTMEPVWVITIHEYQSDSDEDYAVLQEIYSAVTAKSVAREK